MAWHKCKGIRIISYIDSNNYVMKNVCSIIYLDGISQTAQNDDAHGQGIHYYTIARSSSSSSFECTEWEMWYAAQSACASVCMSLCPVSCTPVVYGATFMSTQNTNAVEYTTTSRRTNGRANEQNERAYQNKRFKCTFPCVCVWHRRNSKQKIFRCVGLFWCAGTLCIMYLFRGYCLFIWLASLLAYILSAWMCARIFVDSFFYKFVALGWPRG